MIEDKYRQGLSLPAIESSTVSSVAKTLFSWLRSFWTDLYKDKNFIKRLQGARATRYAQLYLDLLENIQLLDHKNAPVFHRERWYPVIVRKSAQNDSSASKIKLGSDKNVVLGTQTNTDVFKDDTVIKLGENTEYRNVVTYSLPEKVVTVLSCIVDNIADPKIILKNGEDFSITESSLVIRKEHDPFSEGSGFAVFDIPESIDSAGDEEAVLWACDTLIDKNFVMNYTGYAVGLETESTETYKRIVSLLWDAISDGISIEHLHEVLAAMCCVPTILDEKEIVEAVYGSGGNTKVITDKNVYTLGPRSTKDSVLDCVKTGNTLYKGCILDKSVRIYPFIQGIDTVEKKSGFTKEQFMSDVRSLSIPAAIVRSDLCGGFYAGWEPVDVIYNGNDSNGNPRLSFDLGMPDDEDARYWASVWLRFEKAGISMKSCFKEPIDDNISEGEKCGEVVPIEFFLRNLVGANTLIVVIDTDLVADTSPVFDPNFFNAFRKLIPEYIRLYFIEHGKDIEDAYLNGDDSIEDETHETASVGSYEEDYEDFSEDVVSSKWVRKCKKSKYEDDEDDE